VSWPLTQDDRSEKMKEKEKSERALPERMVVVI